MTSCEKYLTALLQRDTPVAASFQNLHDRGIRLEFNDKADIEEYVAREDSVEAFKWLMEHGIVSLHDPLEDAGVVNIYQHFGAEKIIAWAEAEAAK